jgi:hypothetical protein
VPHLTPHIIDHTNQGGFTMASLNLNEKRIYWSENGSPRKMYIGKCSQRVGREILRHVEALLDTKGTALPPPGDTVTWLREVAEPRIQQLIEGFVGHEVVGQRSVLGSQFFLRRLCLLRMPG